MKQNIIFLQRKLPKYVNSSDKNSCQRHLWSLLINNVKWPLKSVIQTDLENIYFSKDKRNCQWRMQISFFNNKIITINRNKLEINDFSSSG